MPLSPALALTRANLSRFAGTLAVGVVVLLALSPQVSAVKYFDSFIGATGTGANATGGLFNAPRDLAINLTGTPAQPQDGWVYVVDASNHRVQALDADGGFRFAIGRDVVPGEVQRVAVNATAGTFTLSFDGQGPTAPIAFNAPAAAVQTALEDLANLAPGDVVVSGGPGNSGATSPYVVGFKGARAGADVAEMTAADVDLTGGGDSVAVTTVLAGNNLATERCTVAAHCKAGLSGSLGGEFNTAQGIDIDQATGHFFVRERNSNARVQEFTATGEFVRAFGRDVVQPGGAGEATETFDERQTISLISNFDFFSRPTGGTFALTFSGQTTAAIPYNATPAAVDSALEALSNVGAGSVAVTGVDGGPWTIDFTGALAGTNVAELTGNGSALTEPFGFGAFVSPATLIQGGPAPGFETCTVAAQCKAGTTGGLTGQFGSSSTDTTGIAVAPPGSPHAGEVYVADPGNRRVHRFAVPADPLAPVTVGVPFGSAAEFDQPNWPRDLAADDNGIVYAGTQIGAGTQINGNGAVRRFDTTAGPNGEFKGTISPDVDDDFFGRGPVAGLEVDHATDHLLVGRAQGPASTLTTHGIYEYDVSADPEQVSLDHLTAIHGVGLGVFTTSSPSGIGVGDGRVIFSTTVNVPALPGIGTGSRLLVLDDDGVEPAPTVALLPADDVGCESATLRATVNPQGPTGFPTSYQFEVSKSGLPNDWKAVGPTALVGANGDGGDPVPVEQAVSGLDANTPLYWFRVRTVRSPNQPSVASPPQFFATAPCAPTAETVAAQNVSDTSAQLVGRVRPGGLTTSYWFEWGDTDYGNVVPAQPGSVTGSSTRAVAERIDDLDPDRVYHFRLCVQNALASVPVCGADRVFETELLASAAPRGRALEMVSSPDKVLRRGASHGLGADFGSFADGMPAPSGDALYWTMFAGVIDPDAGGQFSLDEAPEVRRRRATGWYGEALLNVAPPGGVSAAIVEPTAHSVDLKTHMVGSRPSLFPTGEGVAVRVMGDTGGPLSAGWYPFTPVTHYFGEAKTADRSDRIVGFSTNRESGEDAYRNVVPLDDELAPAELTPPQTAGEALFLAGPPTWAAADLVNECTGSGPGDATRIPERKDAGTPGVPADDVLGERDCGQGSPTDVRGASVSGQHRGASSTLMSEDGRRVFFMSPSVNEVDALPCAASTGPATACPPQLFVRQLDGANGPVVRWLSRPENALFDAPQSIAALGNGVAFEGASKNGSVVYFRTNAPLTVDDPNGGNPATGSASTKSWDLYRYELSPGNDPAAGDPGDRLTRVTGGPGGAFAPADPNTNCAAVLGSGPGADCGSPAGAGSVVRFMSDDGERVYFVTAAAIPGARNARPAGGATDPTPGDAQVNASTRNLYLYDASKDGPDAYEFVARVPFTRDRSLEMCLSSGGFDGGPVHGAHTDGRTTPAIDPVVADVKCVHGSSSGDGIVFESRTRLTEDDLDDAVDVYLYDALRDRLTRISATDVDQSPYTCETTAADIPTPTVSCNADLGMLRIGWGALPKAYNFGSEGLRGWNVGEDAEGKLTSVFFESRLALADGAAANDRMKVYEWSRSGARMRLISPPGSTESAFYTGNGRDGRDVFFWTQQRLSGWEIDGADGDIYNATLRPDPVPEPSPAPDVCAVLAGGCQGSDAPRVSAPVDTDRDAGEAAAQRRVSLSLRGIGAKMRRQAARKGVVTLRVSSSSAGRLVVTARARTKTRGSATVVGRSAITAGEGANVVRVRLAKRARAVLRRGRSLNVRVTATLPGARTQTMTVRLPGASR